MTTADPRRLAVSLLGVGAAIGLVLLLQGLWNGQLVQITTYEDHAGADLFVAQSGTESILGDRSTVPLTALEELAAVPQVQQADPVHIHYTVFDLHGEKEFVLLVGSDPGGLGGPWELSGGRAPAAIGEAVLDRTFAEEHDLDVGAEFEMGGRVFRTVGVSEGTRSWMTSLVFVTADTAREMTGGGEVATFLLVRTDEPEAAAAAIRAQTGLDPILPTTLADNDRKILAGIMEGPVLLMIGIAFAAATLVVALTVYSGVVERLREYGIVKAMGAGPGMILRLIVGQTIFLAVAGSGIGYLMYLGGTWLVGRVRPQFWFSLQWRHLLVLAASAIGMALVAAIIPARRLGRLDPASVYRGW
ncbi:MAG: ABC transporter permease [Acidimicrobiia bacterium]